MAGEACIIVRGAMAEGGESRTRRRAASILVAALWLALGSGVSGAGPVGESGAAPPEQQEQYDASTPKSILELQLFRSEQSAVLALSGTPVRLISLNPGSNSWFLLVTGRGDAQSAASYHIENPDPRGQRLELSPGPPVALLITGKRGTEQCDLWAGNPAPLETARASGLPYAPLCGGRLYLRNRVSGSRTNLERVTDFLRDNVWQGEEIVGFARSTFFTDSFVESGKQVAAGATMPTAEGPNPAAVDPAFAGQAIAPDNLGLGLSGAPSGRMTLGIWYPVTGLPGVYASVIQPNAISGGVQRGPGQTNASDTVKARALQYMIAFDLTLFDLGFALGTDHPRIGWSPRVPDAMRNDKLPGPDGVGSATPLVTTGMVSPTLVRQTIATFAAGFKREHGAFKYGEFATRNHGSHYGFVEQGVIFSKLQPGLATLLVLDDGSVEMKTWTGQDERLLPRIRFARQNGVPLVEPDPQTGKGVPGALVTNWGPGNWSGSANTELRTLRAGACLQDSGSRRFLVYGYFSTAIPQTMARTFLAFDCRYAMMLDMNALEHTYLALYVPRNGGMQLQHLIPGMSEVDKTDADGGLIPRFIGFPDNRDFFYLTRREDSP